MNIVQPRVEGPLADEVVPARAAVSTGTEVDAGGIADVGETVEGWELAGAGVV